MRSLGKYLLVAFLYASLSMPGVMDLNSDQMSEVVRIARMIAFIQPNLPSHKYFEHGYAILTASERYGIDPILLVAITHRESSFREDIPVGKAGEIGLCQIRKMWVRNSLFKKEFGKVSVRDLRNPIKAFSFAAWILKDLRTLERPSRTLPYWCYYNSKQFENRLKYFLAVNQNIVRIRKTETLLSDRSMASIREFSRSKNGKAVVTNHARLATFRASIAD